MNHMKAFYSKIILFRLSVSVIVLLSFFMIQAPASAQVVNAATKNKFSFGVGLFDDIWLKVPSGVKTRTINQGVQLFGMYNVPFGKSIFGFSIGLGLTAHNAYGNFIVNSKSDSTWLPKIPDSVSYRRSKFTLVYLELPIEFHFKTKSKVSVGIGFKVGRIIGSSMKYVGDGNIATTNFTMHSTERVRFKMWGIKNLEQFTYGPTLRVGYRWFNVTASYMLSHVFTSNGPEMYPISVGFVLLPF
jgi:hypothetical protein